MKKTLLIMLLASGSLYAQMQEMEILLPRDRESLAVSMRETAEAYQANGRTKNANEYFEASLNIYPIGDAAHILAKKLGKTLDDETTYSNFITFGDLAIKNNNYQLALANYLMAKELQSPMSLYEKIATTYTALNDTNNAILYQELSQGFTDEMTSAEVSTNVKESHYPNEDELEDETADEEIILDFNMNEDLDNDTVLDATIEEDPNETMNEEMINTLDETLYLENEN